MALTAEGVAASQQHHDTEALAAFRQAALREPGSALAQYLLAEALSNSNPPPQSPEGKEEFAAAERAVAIDPKMADAQNLLSTLYLRQQDFVRSAEHSEAVLAVNPNDQQAIFHLILAARHGVQKEELPELVKRLSVARAAAADPSESPHGYLTEAK